MEPTYKINGTNPGTAIVTKPKDIADAFVRGHLTKKHANLNTTKNAGTLSLISYDTPIAWRVSTSPTSVEVTVEFKNFSKTTSRTQNVLMRLLLNHPDYQSSHSDGTRRVFLLAKSDNR